MIYVIIRTDTQYPFIAYSESKAINHCSWLKSVGIDYVVIRGEHIEL